MTVTATNTASTSGLVLCPVPGRDGTWDVHRDGERVGTWQRTDAGAVLDDCAGERVAVISAFAGSQCAVVAGCGARAGQWSDLAHKILAGRCEMAGA